MPPAWSMVFDYPDGKREMTLFSWEKGEPLDRVSHNKLKWVVYRRDPKRHTKYYKVG